MVTPIDPLGTLQVFVNYNFSYTRFPAHKIGVGARLHVGYCNRNKATCLKTASLFHACLSCRFTISVYMMTTLYFRTLCDLFT